MFFVLYSNTDDIILYWFFSILILIFIIDLIIKKIKFLDFFNLGLKMKDSKQSLENYTFNYNNDLFIGEEVIAIKQVSLSTKIILYVFSIVLILTPLYEFIKPLKPLEYFYGWSCFS